MDKKFCEITNRNELAEFLGVSKKTLTNVLYYKHVESFYVSFDIPKKSGGTRRINAPFGLLKYIQTQLLKELYFYRTTIRKEKNIKTNISHAFEKGKDIISNAEIHRNKRYIVNIDLKNFFDCFHFGRIKGYFIKNEFFSLPVEVATVIAQLTCYNGKLPQGAPTSPIITNMICNILDYKILSLAKKYHLDYTRYADDLTFSTNDKNFESRFSSFYNSLCKIIQKNGFEINSEKTRFIFKDSKQSVTGLIVNKKINVDKQFYKTTRAMAYQLYKTGSFSINDKQGSLLQLEGRFSFINEIERYNNRKNGLTQSKFYNMSAKEKDFQKFLFYKYFYANDKPIIVTEGKTDIVYIKSALKNLYKEYPNLISKNADNKFEFKVSFFKRSNRIRFFFNMSQDGADAMKNLYRFFYGGDNMPNYIEYFNKLTGSTPHNPVILVFDNEIKNKAKPLYKFLKFANSIDKISKDGGSIQLIPNSNIYLATHQVVEGKEESEIEDLFDETTLSHKLNGKSFSKSANFDKNLYYGKDHFSKYISSNYNTIDFSNFKVLLDKIDNIVTIYD